MKEIVLDTETTGISIKEGHRIVEIGCIELDNLVPINKFHAYLNPERKVSEKAFEVHGYSDEFLSTHKKFSEIVEEFLKFIEGKDLIIHNAEFDLAHINNELSILGMKKVETKNILDTLELAREKFPGSSISLDALCKRYKIDNSRRTKHTALIDCELLYKVYVNLIDQKEPKLNFAQNNEQIINDFQNSNLKYSKRLISPSKEEMNLHKNFLKSSLKKNHY